MARSVATIDRTIDVAGWSRSDLNSEVHKAAVDAGYRPLSVSMDRASYAQTRRPRWATVAAIITAPTIIGLAFLLVRSTETFTTIIQDDHTGVGVKIHGRVERGLLEDLVRLCGDPTKSNGMASSVPAGVTLAPTVSGSPASPGRSIVPPANDPGLAIPGVASSPLPPPSNPAGMPASSGQYPVATPSGAVAPASNPVPYPPSAGSGSAPPNPWLMPPSPSVADGDLFDADSHTQVVARPFASGATPTTGPSGMRLLLEDGQTFDISTVLLIGRNPSPAESDDSPGLVKVANDTVSKTHMAVGITDGGCWVSDRYSTNGSALLRSDGTEVPLPAGERIPIDGNCAVRLGAYWVRIERLT